MKEEVMTGFPYKQNPKLALLKADGDSLISAMLLTRRSTSLTRRGEQPVLDNAYYLLPRHLLVWGCWTQKVLQKQLYNPLSHRKEKIKHPNAGPKISQHQARHGPGTGSTEVAGWTCHLCSHGWLCGWPCTAMDTRKCSQGPGLGRFYFLLSLGWRAALWHHFPVFMCVLPSQHLPCSWPATNCRVACGNLLPKGSPS